jgi:copper homeostasis protein
LSHRILIEACIASVEDALAAAHGGADRLELNGALELDGLTPTPGLFNAVRAAVNLPVIVMIRPRPYGFQYSNAEFRVMQADIDLLLSLGAEGVAVGILQADGSLDVDRMRQLRNQIENRALVCHRAFDITPNAEIALEQLVDTGVDRVLTSGQLPTALEGAARIAALVRQANDRIEILPGGGIAPSNAAVLVHQTGCTQIHGTFRKPGIPIPALTGPDRWRTNAPSGTDAEVVATVRSVL